MNILKIIKEIGKKKEVVICPADKAAGFVILNKKDYEEEMQNLLKVDNTYKKLKENPKLRYKKKLKAYIKKGKDKGILSKKEADYLLSESTKTSVIYYVLKIHRRVDKPPGRPIISGINSLFSWLGEYLDQFLKPLVLKWKSYLRDSTQLIMELQNIKGAENCLLATTDVSSLYTSIVQKDGLEGVEKALCENTKLRQEQIGFILGGLQLAMESNYFWYRRNY